MPCTIRIGDDIVTLEVNGTEFPFAIVDLPRLHAVWSVQENYRQIRIENDQYENGRPAGGFDKHMPWIGIDDEIPPFRTWFWRRSVEPRIEIGFVNGRHRLDRFFRQGALILPVQTSSQNSKTIIEQYFGASQDAIDRYLIDPAGYIAAH